MKRAIAVARVSSDAQASEDRTSLSEQLRLIREWAAANGYEIIQELQETLSGTTELDPDEKSLRPLFWAAWDALKGGQTDAVIYHLPDRFCRDKRRYGLIATNYIVESWNHGDGVRFVEKEPERSAQGVLVAFVESWKSGEELKDFARRAIQGRHGKAGAGKPMMSVVAYGYQKKNGCLTKDPKQAHVVGDIYGWALEGDGIDVICNRLEELGVPPVGKPGREVPEGWHTSMVHRILTKPRYYGEGSYNRWEYESRPTNGRKNRRRLQMLSTTPVKYPPIVSKDDFFAVQAMLKEHKRIAAGTVKHHYLLRGLVKCRFCGKAARAKTHGPRPSGWTQSLYECGQRARSAKSRKEHVGIRRTWAASFVETKVREWLVEFLSNPDVALRRAKVHKEWSATERHERDQRRDVAQRELDGLSTEETRVVTAFSKGNITEELLSEQREPASQTRRVELENTIEGLNGAIRDIETDSAFAHLAAEAIKAQPRGIEQLLTILSQNGSRILEVVETEPMREGWLNPWPELVRKYVRRVWLENDGEGVTVEGVIPGPRLVDTLCPRS
jgi:site-specific DNA recombinase